MRKLSKILASFALACTLAIGVPVAAAETAPIYTGYFSDTAVQGHDVVGYFTDGAPVKGSDAFASTYKGAEFKFKNADNLAAFEADPEAYLPQYGGYCAWAVSQGYTAKGNAKNWKIVDGKLYLNFNNSVQKKWEADVPGFIQSADKNWPTVLE